MGIANIFFDIAIGIAGGDLVIPAILVLLTAFGLMIFTKFPRAGGLLVVGLIGLMFYSYAPIHAAFKVIYFGSLVLTGILVALLFWAIFSG